MIPQEGNPFKSFCEECKRDIFTIKFNVHLHHIVTANLQIFQEPDIGGYPGKSTVYKVERFKIRAVVIMLNQKDRGH